jgi:Mor family transcriptional regulator
MPQKSSPTEKTYNFVYQTTNKVNNKIYVGFHTTDTLDDGYIGCGVYSQAHAEGSKRYGLKSAFIDAVCKYGYTSFSREIIEFFPSKEEAKLKEIEIVDEVFIRRSDTYNIKTGGLGGASLHPLYDSYDEVLLKFKNGTTLKELATEYRVGLTLIRSVLRFRGEIITKIPRKITPQREKKYSHLIPQIIEEYKSGDSILEIEERYHMDFKTVKKFVEGVKQFKQCYIAISPEKNIQEFTSFKAFHKDTGLFPAGVQQCLSGKIRHYKGWIFFKKEDWNGSTEIEDKKKINSIHKGKKLVDNTGNILEITTNLSEFTKEHQMCYELVQKLLSGKIKKYKEFTVYEEIREVL